MIEAGSCVGLESVGSGLKEPGKGGELHEGQGATIIMGDGPLDGCVHQSYRIVIGEQSRAPLL